MTIPRINIDQQRATIGITFPRPALQIDTPQPSMKITVEDARLEMHWDMPVFSTDKTEYYNELGLKKPETLRRDQQAAYKQAGLENTAKITRDGWYIGAVEQQGNRVAELEKRRTLAPPTVTVNVKAFPSHLPQMSWEISRPETEYFPYEINIDVDGEYMPSITLDGSLFVEVYLRDRPYLTITVAEQVEAAMDPYRTHREINEAI
jgi:hypothetical protein